MTLLQSLYMWYEWLFSSPTLAAKNCPIVELPDELVLCIMDHLAAHDKFLLSHTCRSMRRLASCDWDEYLSSRCPSERNDFLMGLAYNMPNQWACERCGRLHAIDRFDLPSGRRFPSCIRGTGHGARIWANYYLEHHHIQLALKLSHLGANKNYLKKLLATHYHTIIGSGTSIVYAAHPKIVEGHFLLFEKIVIGEKHCRRPYEPMQQTFISFCPHLVLINSWLGFQYVMDWFPLMTELDKSIALAMRNPGKAIHGHCKWCPTDYSVILSELNGRLIFGAWHDLGGYGSVLNPYWSSQVRLQDRHRHHHQPTPQSDRLPGGYRDAYLNAPSGEDCRTL